VFDRILDAARVGTRPHIANITSIFSHFVTQYGDERWKAAKRAIRYIKGTVNHCLMLRRAGKNIV
jgi:hypothetical protein